MLTFCWFLCSAHMNRCQANLMRLCLTLHFIKEKDLIVESLRGPRNQCWSRISAMQRSYSLSAPEGAKHPQKRAQGGRVLD